jgi:hypothetical protein
MAGFAAGLNDQMINMADLIARVVLNPQKFLKATGEGVVYPLEAKKGLEDYYNQEAQNLDAVVDAPPTQRRNKREKQKAVSASNEFKGL